MITNMELRVELCVLNLILKWSEKYSKKKKNQLIFINFGIRSSQWKTPKKEKPLMFECYNILDPMEWVEIF
jgi:hypothetical protein